MQQQVFRPLRSSASPGTLQRMAPMTVYSTSKRPRAPRGNVVLKRATRWFASMISVRGPVQSSNEPQDWHTTCVAIATAIEIAPRTWGNPTPTPRRDNGPWPPAPLPGSAACPG
jgi:hypothetical protein